MTTTALDLVNRIRAKRRDATSSIITDRQGVAYLEILNSAITTALEERTWNFQIRSDGYLKTIPSYTSTGISIANGDDDFSISDYDGAQATLSGGDFQVRIMFSDDAAFGNTTFRVDSAVVSGGGTVLGKLAQAWPGTTTATSATWKTMVWEYALPQTVREVLSVIHQETPVRLEFENEQNTFDRMIPTPQDYISDSPELVMVGGLVDPTEYISLTASVYQLAFKVYPIPSSTLAFNYSYVYRQPKLTLLTDVLYHVTPAVEEQIVDLATARVIALLEKDIATGLPLEAKVLKALDRLHRNHQPDQMRRKAMKSYDHIGGRFDPWPPRTVEGL